MSQRQGAPFRVASATTRRLALRAAVLSAIAAGALVAASSVDARITKISVTTTESPTFGGHSFAGVGTYDKLVGTATGELDPADPKNALIVDLSLAPRNAIDAAPWSRRCGFVKFGAGLFQESEQRLHDRRLVAVGEVDDIQ